MMSAHTPAGFDTWESYRSACEELSRAVVHRADKRLRLAKETSNLFRPRSAAAGNSTCGA